MTWSEPESPVSRTSEGEPASPKKNRIESLSI